MGPMTGGTHATGWAGISGHPGGRRWRSGIGAAGVLGGLALGLVGGPGVGMAADLPRPAPLPPPLAPPLAPPSAAPSAPPDPSPAWEQITTPAPGPARVIGKTGAGCLAGAVSLADAPPPGVVILRPARNRTWGHPDLIAFVDRLAATASALGAAPLLVGDLAQPRGGPMPQGHRSHMTGLDVDLWLGAEGAPPYTAAWIADPRPRSAVGPDGERVDDAVFSPAVRALVRAAALEDGVDRLFLNPALKRALCQDAADEAADGAADGAADWLRKVRPWWGHDSHMHIRLVCPATSPDCLPQDPIPPGPGCDASLDWWFSAEARAPKTPSSPVPSPPPRPRPIDLPSACAAVAGAP